MLCIVESEIYSKDLDSVLGSGVVPQALLVRDHVFVAALESF